MKKKNKKKNIAGTNGVMQAISTERDHLEAYSALLTRVLVDFNYSKSQRGHTDSGKMKLQLFFFCWYKNPASPLAL